MLKSLGCGSSTQVASATLCHLQRSSSHSGALFQPYPNDINLKKQLMRGKKSKNNGGLRLVSGGGIIKAALAISAEPTTTVITKVIVKKITGVTSSSNLTNGSQPPQKFLQLGFASTLLDPSNSLLLHTYYLNKNYNLYFKMLIFLTFLLFLSLTCGICSFPPRSKLSFQ